MAPAGAADASRPPRASPRGRVDWALVGPLAWERGPLLLQRLPEAVREGRIDEPADRHPQHQCPAALGLLQIEGGG
jgi:hypothetical protein